MLSCYKSVLRCASPSAHESGIFELLRQLYPARLLFFRRLVASSLLTKSRSPHAVGTGVANASEATHAVLGSNALEKRSTLVQMEPIGDPQVNRSNLTLFFALCRSFVYFLYSAIKTRRSAVGYKFAILSAFFAFASLVLYFMETKMKQPHPIFGRVGMGEMIVDF